MRSPFSRLMALAAALAVVVVLPAAAQAAPPDAVSTYEWSSNLEPVGHSARDVPLVNATPGAGIINSDLAFWRDKAFQGTYEGFRVVDISNPKKPREIVNYADCSPATTQGNQGDVIVWDDILVRARQSICCTEPASRASTSSTSATSASRSSWPRSRSPRSATCRSG